MRLLNAMSASEAKTKFYDVLTQATQGKIIHIIRHSRPEAVLIGIDKYQDLVDRVEELEHTVAALKAEQVSKETAQV